jgi:hypothetical protein
LGLKELRKSWDISNWVLQLFFQLLDELTATKLHITDFEDATNAPKETPMEQSKDAARERLTSSQLGEDLSTLAPSQTKSIDDGLNSAAEVEPTKEVEDFFMHSGIFSGFDVDGWGDGFQQFLDSSVPRMDGRDAESLDHISRCM